LLSFLEGIHVDCGGKPSRRNIMTIFQITSSKTHRKNDPNDEATHNETKT
jgi:hypothetical protein